MQEKVSSECFGRPSNLFAWSEFVVDSTTFRNRLSDFLSADNVGLFDFEKVFSADCFTCT